MRLPLQVLVPPRACAGNIPPRLVANPYFRTLDRMDNAGSDGHLRPKNIVLRDIDRANMNPGPYSLRPEFYRPRIEV